MLKGLLLCSLLTIPLFGEQSPCNAGFYGCDPIVEEEPAKNCQPEEPCFSACACHAGPSIGIASVRHRAPGGIGYNNGYTTVDLFYLLDSGNFFPFIDIRAHGFNDGKPAYNIGGGLRYLSPCSNYAMGLNVYYDYRDADHTNYHALGMGAEFLWPAWSVTVNGYAPVNRHKRSYKTGFAGFRGHTAHFYKKYETAMSGADLNVKWELFRYIPETVCPHGDGSIVGDVIFGGYYFVGDYGETAGGGLFKFRLSVSRHFFAEGQVSYDNQFNWRGQGEVGLRFTFGAPVERTDRLISECVDLIALEEKLADKPERFEIIVTTTHKKRGSARNLLTGGVQNFIFVSPHGGSDGSFESPFATLSDALAVSGPGDTIYLLADDGTPIQPSGALVMQESQSLLGSGTCHRIDTSFGSSLLPNQSEQMPVLATGGEVNYLTIDNNTTIAGVDFSVDDSVTNLIGAAQVNNCNILYNRISPDGAGLISGQVIAFAAEGRIRIVGNTITGLSPMSGVLIDTQANNESRVEAYGNVWDLGSGAQYKIINSGISQNFFENNTITGSEAYNYLQTDGRSSTLIRNNAYDGDAATTFGVVIDNDGGTLQTVIEGNQLTLVRGVGLAGIDITGREMNAKVAKNQATEFVGLIFLEGPVESIQSPNLGVTGIEETNGQTMVEVLEPVSYISFE